MKMAVIKNRYEFVFLFDVENGNPNGDPDAGGMPRLDSETSHGLVSDVCIKRKIRNYIEVTKEEEVGFKIYVKEKAVLNRQHELAYKEYDLKPETNKLPKDEKESVMITNWMCNNFFDIRTFGAVMTTAVNAGQVRGPVQMNFSKSIDSVLPGELTITRMAVTKEEDLEKERTMGKKFIVPYGLYRCEGYISAYFAEKTGFSEEDIELLWEAMINMFEHDHSAGRGKMVARKLYVFKHDSKLGNAPSHKLFDLIKINRIVSSNEPIRSFNDYDIVANRDDLPSNVEMTEKIDGL
jgi:CRISPR-associated protein Csd2